MNAYRLAGFALFTLLATGCFDSTRYDHSPPAGQGAIIVDNTTSRDLRVFINGEDVGRVRAFRSRAFDRPPGVYRVVLNERNGNRSFRDDIDVLANRLTILETTTHPGRTDQYSVFVFFD